MGGRGSETNGKSINTNNIRRGIKLIPKLQPTPRMKITQVAEKAFSSTYYDARRYIDTWDDKDRNLSFHIDFGEHGYVSIRTLRGVQAKINSEYKHLDMDEKFKLRSKEELRKRRLALDAMQRGLNYSYAQNKEFWKWK